MILKNNLYYLSILIYHYVLNYLKLTILIAEMLDAAELGEFPSLSDPTACYFKCVMEKGGVVKKLLFLQNVIKIKIDSLKLYFFFLIR